MRDGTSVPFITVPNHYRFEIKFEGDEVDMIKFYDIGEVVIEFEDCSESDQTERLNQ